MQVPRSSRGMTRLSSPGMTIEMCDFEKKVRDNLIECGIDPSQNPRLGVAVSGGADSISLLLALSEILKSQSNASPLYVITVNHNIRPASESRGDVDYVLKVCEELRRSGCRIECEVVEFERGRVDEEERRRGGGVEEAARYLRYAAFEKFIAGRELTALCLAHNQNDQLETVLMRFLQGSPAQAAAGIQARRGSFVRPLLDIERRNIEEYVKSRGYSWRTDKTNYETNYLRNKIRLQLIPLLDELFPGWKKSVLSGAEKAFEDSSFINAFMLNFQFLEQTDDGVKIPLKGFINAPDAVKYRLLFEACNKAGENSRIPRAFLKDVINSIENTSEAVPDTQEIKDNSDNFTKHYNKIDIIKKKNALFVKKHSKNNTDLVFFDIIEETGEYEFPFGLLSVFKMEENVGEQNKRGYKVCVSVKETFNSEKESFAAQISLPFCIRSIQLSDLAQCADGSEKKVSDIISDWHVPAEKRSFIPVLQILNNKTWQIKCIFAGFLGYKDWIVK